MRAGNIYIHDESNECILVIRARARDPETAYIAGQEDQGVDVVRDLKQCMLQVTKDQGAKSAKAWMLRDTGIEQLSITDVRILDAKNIITFRSILHFTQRWKKGIENR